jgi:uncharacterized membrane protein YdbT with pleckstrin-like domain
MAKTPKEAVAEDDEAARRRKADAEAKAKAAKKKKEEEEDDDEDDEEDDDEEDERAPHVLNANETRNALKITWQFLKPYLPAHRKGIRLIMVAILIETIYNTSFPLLLKVLIDDAINADNPQMLIYVLSTMFALGFVSSIVMIWFEWLNATSGTVFSTTRRTCRSTIITSTRRAWSCSASPATSRRWRRPSTTACSGACCRSAS